MPPLLRIVRNFFIAVFKEYVLLLTGGLITAIVAVFEHYRGSGVSWPWYSAILLLFVVIACYKVWLRDQGRIGDLEGDLKIQEMRIQELRSELAVRKERTANLTIHVVEGSQYLLKPIGNVPRAGFEGAHLEFHLLVNNTGSRDSTINAYRIHIEELRRDFAELVPFERVGNSLQGRHFSTTAQKGLSTTGLVRVPAEGVTDQGTLTFWIPGINLDDFAEAGFVMRGEERRFDPIHCTLTLTDMTGVSASRQFELREA
jgi:hypothetical protein